jgi:hypothetical protein
MIMSNTKTDFVAKASDLNWPLGFLAPHIDHANERFYYSRRSVDNEDETVSWHYVSPTGRTITVFND